jgi:MoxR-like ATPase
VEASVHAVQGRIENALTEIRKAIVGQDLTLEFMLASVLVKGHVLLEGVPGTAKTLMVRTLARALHLDFRRIQFTPDLMPSDIIGTNVFSLKTNEFVLRQGPIFTDILLADEINRTPAKTQSALLEAMEERHSTIDGVSYGISPVFTVFATQNPIEYEGTYHLPEAQLDRFHFKLDVGYPGEEEEDSILQLHNAGFDPGDLDSVGVAPVLDLEDVLVAREVVRGTTVEEEVVRYVRRLVRASREVQEVLVGAGPRAGIHMLTAAKALAVFRGRAFVTPDDVKAVARPVLRHRLVLQPDAEVEGVRPDEVVSGLLESVPVPR